MTKNSNYEKAKEEGIKDYDKRFYTIHINVDWQYERCKCRKKKSCKEQLKDFLSSFAEKIKDGVEKDAMEKSITQSHTIKGGGIIVTAESLSDSQTIKE